MRGLDGLRRQGDAWPRGGGGHRLGTAAAFSTSAAVGLAAAFVLVFAASASAQYNKTEPPKTRFRVGPLRFSPEARAAQRRPRHQRPPRPDEPPRRHARSSCAAPSRASCRCAAGCASSARAGSTGATSAASSTERSTDPGGEGRAEVDLGPFTLIGGGGALQARQLYSIDIDERILRQERWGNGGAEWRLTPALRRSRAAPSTAASATTRAPAPRAAASAPPRPSTATTSPAPWPLRYTLTSMTTAVATGDVIEDEFQLSAPGLNTTRSYRYMAGVELGEKAFVTGRFLAGMRDFPAEQQRQPAELPRPRLHGPARPAALQPPAPRRARSCATSTSPPRPSAPPRSAPATPTSSPACRARPTSTCRSS